MSVACQLSSPSHQQVFMDKNALTKRTWSMLIQGRKQPSQKQSVANTPHVV